MMSKIIIFFFFNISFGLFIQNSNANEINEPQTNISNKSSIQTIKEKTPKTSKLLIKPAYSCFEPDLSKHCPVINQSKELINKRLDELSEWWNSDKKKSFKYLVLKTAVSWLKTSYAEGTLTVSNNENLVLRTDYLDCLTFIELSLAMARAVACNEPTIPQVQTEIQNLRYRGGEINGYLSRLHYTAEWLTQSTNNLLFKDITKDLNGKKISRKISWISNHLKAYPNISVKNDTSLLKKIESNLSSLSFYYIPTEKVEEIEALLKSGDIILIVTSKHGLLISHIGMITILNESRHLLHSSKVYGYVGVSKYTISEYLKRKANRKGIIVVRPLLPKKCF